MNSFSNNPFEHSHNDDDFLSFDPTLPDFMRTRSGSEIPASDACTFISGMRHPTLAHLSELTERSEGGSILLPSTVPLLNIDSSDPLSRAPIYGVDLVFQSRNRAKHLAVFGPTGAGKNVNVLDMLRFSAIFDPTQTVITFSLKSSDYGPIKTICDATGKKLVVVNLNDAWRSLAWNPLATSNRDIANECIRRFADSVKNPLSHDSEFWTQWIKTGLRGAWEAGYRSFPKMYHFFSNARRELINQLGKHENASSIQFADFLTGDSSNAQSVLASIVGALSCFLSEKLMRTMSKDELHLDRLFRQPVCLHVEMPETSLETQQVLYQMLARSITDQLIDNAEESPATAAPATIFYDDMPSLGFLLSPSRMLTMRSRGIGIIAGAQTLSSLELVYGASCRTLIDNFHTKIVLPGSPASDANYFALSSGEQLVSLPTFEGQASSFLQRPLLSSASIRSPNYSHPAFGMPATIFSGALAFQAYLQRSYEHPRVATILRAARGISGRERLRASGISLTRTPRAAEAPRDPKTYLPPGITNTKGWSEVRIQKKLAEVQKSIGFDVTTGSALKWWKAFVEENQTRLAVVLRLAEELAVRKANITEFFLAYVYSNTDSIGGNLSYLDYLTEKKAHEARKRKAADGNAPFPENLNLKKAPLISTIATTGIAVVLSAIGKSKIEMIKIVKSLTDSSLMNCKNLVESAPVLLGRCTSQEDAEKAVHQIVAAGGQAYIH